ncbi:MAG: FAD/NAD(P)-binding oxidoreductase [Clostridia bacterium]|nr:FAD/NAD(P)-binding oxidoreductase [Clostridia bacterium]
MFYDVAIIGAGVIGSLTARKLSQYNLKIALLEKCNDVACATSKANSGIVHSGFDARPGTIKAKLNVDGAKMMPEVCKSLHVPYKGIGSLVVAFSEKEMNTLKELYQRGITNGLDADSMEILNKDALLKMEPNISPNAVGALLATTAGIVCPYELTIAAAECAAINGVEFLRNCGVNAIKFENDTFILSTEQGEISAKYIINAAGIHADNIARMIGDDSVNIKVRLGEYALLDKSVGGVVNHVIFQCPTELGKGVLVSPTIDGNIIVGPTTVEIESKDNSAIGQEALKNVFKSASLSVPSIGMRNTITSFGGLRAHDITSDFIIGSSKINNNFINVAGIESPGLASSPAIADYVGEIFESIYNGTLEKKTDYNPSRKEPVKFREMTNEQRRELIAKNSAYGRIICRCETVTEGEIIDAINSPIGARDVDGVKRRTRAGMGRCQSGFCGSKVMEILSRELNVPINEITKFGGKSDILYERTK